MASPSPSLAFSSSVDAFAAEIGTATSATGSSTDDIAHAIREANANNAPNHLDMPTIQDDPEWDYDDPTNEMRTMDINPGGSIAAPWNLQIPNSSEDQVGSVPHQMPDLSNLPNL